jgi:hypothetical protein
MARSTAMEPTSIAKSARPTKVIRNEATYFGASYTLLSIGRDPSWTAFVQTELVNPPISTTRNRLRVLALSEISPTSLNGSN